ncbi:MAG TPA: hypothetical protein VJ927_08590 [Actinomycetota bacterium]|nr:hypothetical protein [Actinomycetota bacterium]
MKRSFVLALVLCASVLPALPAASKGGIERGRVGVLLVDHGEPPIYNRDTYASFRKFFDHLIEMGLIPSWVKLIDNGTVLQDPECYGCGEAGASTFLDAWLDRHEGPAVPMPESSSAAAHHVVPGGPGAGEPDVFEQVGLGAWHEWELMGGRSPNYDQKLAKKKVVIERLRDRYGDDLPIRIGYGIDPRIGGGRQGIRQAITALVEKDDVDELVVAYHGVGFSDIMQTHMLRHDIHEVLDEMGADVELRYTAPIGTTDAYVDTVVDEVRRELKAMPPKAPVAIHLSGHGLPTGTCGDYDCGADAYHEYSDRLFARTSRAIEAAGLHDGRLGVFHLYGDGATEEDDAEDEADSPIEALDKRKEAGFEYVIDIPYEFDSDSRDTLIILRTGYGLTLPDWNEGFETYFRYKGMRVKISNSAFGQTGKIAAYEEVIRDALSKSDIDGRP